MAEPLHHENTTVQLDDSSVFSFPQGSEITCPPTPELPLINLPEEESPQPTDQLFFYGDAESPQGLLLTFEANDEHSQNDGGSLLTQAAPATHVGNTPAMDVDPARGLQPTETSAIIQPAVPAAAAAPSEDEQTFLFLIPNPQLERGIYHVGQPVLLWNEFPDATWIVFQAWFRTA
ncbi:hypothetical protein P691DRAFT_807177 [Macrolepiota fuliginosa MF-IS2]|uniref:Uncharacterized protein n=1 Tax=Macrolepiota fuliginosa MF-IS2 TaxID=1400762 RepID=A0A9P6C0F9_9AGAR|nr:hypothetical protein P691DRAFT_807177 [Macrolepiota fuliginosa MF-IS2]